MVSQLLFGEAVELTGKHKRNWVKVRSIHDNYEGWLTDNMIEPAEKKHVMEVVQHVTTDMLSAVSINGQKMQVPFGSSLPWFANGKGMMNQLSYEFEGNQVNRFERSSDPMILIQYARTWLNVPYMWGGRTILGADCSGFVQVVCKVCGIDMPRDAWQQAQEGGPVEKLKDAKAGDLVFFDDKDEIIHVAILLNNEQVIHEYGKVRIDTIDKKGIINSDTGKRTHKLEAIRKLF